MSGGSNNATIAIPGPGWQMMWTYSLDDFQLDIVGFLAVLGEGSILSIAQVSALSRLFYLPRLLPAPQALLRPARPKSLQTIAASVTAVYSGNYKDHLHHVAHVLLGDDMPPFDVRCVRVEKTKRPEHTQETAFEMHTFSKQQQTGSAKDRSQTAMTPGNVSPPVKARSSGPLSWVTLLGSFLSLSLLIISITLGDGMSLIATILLSGLSTLIGYSNKWELKLPQPPKGSESAQGDVVIRYPNGSYLIVKCNEEVARELYFAPEEVRYNLQNETVYRMISLVGTLMLMLGVIFLANAKLQLQFCWGGAYIILNAAHWVAAALPQKLHWDLSCYSVEEEGVEPGPNNQTFTDALFKAILFTKSKDWARIGKPAAPATKVWDEWLQEAEDQALEIKDNGTQLGNIRDPWWATHQGSERGVGIVWKMPTDWKPRAAFARLNKKAGMEEGHGVPVNQPVTTPGAAHTW